MCNDNKVCGFMGTVGVLGWEGHSNHTWWRNGETSQQQGVVKVPQRRSLGGWKEGYKCVWALLSLHVGGGKGYGVGVGGPWSVV